MAKHISEIHVRDNIKRIVFFSHMHICDKKNLATGIINIICNLYSEIRDRFNLI